MENNLLQSNLLNKILIAVLLLCSLLLFHAQSIIPDSATTFSYLQSVFEDGDMFFGDEYEEFNVPPKWSRLSNKHFPINMTPLGSAVLWTPFYLTGKLIYDSLSAIGIELDNKILSMLTFLHFGSIFYGTISILIWFNICRKLFDPKSAVIAIFAVIFGTSFFYYYFWQGTMSHIPSAFMASVFIYLWYSTKPAKNRKWHQWMLLGAIAGMSGLIRWQDFFIAAIIIPEVFNEFIIRKKIIGFIKVSFLFSVSAIALLFLQFIIWYKIYGSFLTIPQGQHLITWFSPEIGDLFFSSYHGLFFITPIYFLIFIGLFLLWKKDRMLTFSFVIVFLIQFYFDSVFNWWGGNSFGVRRLINCSIISAICLTSFVSYLKTLNKFNIVSYSLITISTVWTFVIGFLMFMNYIPGEEYTSYGYIVRSLIFAFKNIHLIVTDFILTRTPLSINKAIIVILVFVFFIIYLIIKNSEYIKKKLPSPNFSILIILMFIILESPFLIIGLIQQDPIPLHPESIRKKLNKLQHLKTTVTKQPTNRDLYLSIGQTHYSLFEYPEAIDNFCKAQNIKYKITDEYGLGVLYFFNEEYDKSLKSFKKYISVYKDQHKVKTPIELSKCFIGTIYYEQRSWKKSLEVFESIKDSKIREEQSVEAAIAKNLWQMGLIDEAKKQLQKVPQDNYGYSLRRWLR